MDLVFFTDGDLQFDLSELELLLDRIEDADVVCGYRIKRRDPLHRLLNAFLWNRLVRILLGLRIRDVNCAFKLFRRSVLANVGKLETDGAMLSTELMIKLQNKGAQIREVGVHHYPRPAGEQTGANPGVVLKAFRELFAMSHRLRNEVR
jgi:glycosyltransferase involved in cell wall biosynthesis